MDPKSFLSNFWGHFIGNRIKIDLKHTDKPIARIADEMNFPYPSFFVQFFKRMTG